VRPALGKMNPRWPGFGEHRDLRKRVLESSRLKDTIKPMNSEGYRNIGGHKDSVDQDNSCVYVYLEGNLSGNHGYG
jgi:hypothetical protein